MKTVSGILGWCFERAALPLRWWRRGPYLLAGLAAAVAGAGAAVYDGGTSVMQAAGAPAAAAEVPVLLERAQRLSGLWREVEAVYDRDIAPIERVLLQYRNDPLLARRIARALIREATRVELEPRVLLAVLLVENPMLDPAARSPVGARGLMQVMPQHRGHWPACPGELEAVETNLCYGARIFADFFRGAGGNVERALLRYNGCVAGKNTPNCHSYPYQVYARAGRASLLAWLHPKSPAGAAAP